MKRLINYFNLNEASYEIVICFSQYNHLCDGFLVLFFVLTSFCQLGTNLDTLEKNESQMRNYITHIG